VKLAINPWSIAAVLGVCLILLAATTAPPSAALAPGGCTRCKNIPAPGGDTGFTMGQPSCPVQFTWGGLDGACNEACHMQSGCKFFVATDCSGLNAGCCHVVGYILHGVIDAWFCDNFPHQIGPDFPCDGVVQLVTFGVGTGGPGCDGIPELSQVLWFTCDPCQ